ncbi:Caspase domain containing protein, putative [Angomonas deanei]|uniref:Caspase domain containing protein, putative n=1 Tax=Angomonas deanei TaxID=59799 RepID=A0A7G2CLC4_9TRYP|nr:Caspase domain containing protein, putative [Angomonas deanei]
MGFDLNCIKNIFVSTPGAYLLDSKAGSTVSGSTSGNSSFSSLSSTLGRRHQGKVDWVSAGKKAFQAAKPYTAQFIGEVERPQEIDIDDAFNHADEAETMKPYEVDHEYEDGNVRALLIGINYVGTSAELSGCCNDVMQELATFQQTGFPVDEMAILVDDDDFPHFTDYPTRWNIIRYMAWLVKGAQEGDVLFMHYSGHGTQAKSNDRYEEYDQVICPMDYTTAGCILDNDIFNILGRNLPKGVRLTVLFDCCHSGTMLDLPYIFVADGHHSHDHDDHGEESHMKQIRNDNFCYGDILMISGCKDAQTSADVGNTATLGNGTAGAGGAGTQCLTYILLNTDNLMYYDVMELTRAMLIEKEFDQVPQLSCSKPLNMHSKFTMLKTFEIDQGMLGTLPPQVQEMYL